MASEGRLSAVAAAALASTAALSLVMAREPLNIEPEANELPFGLALCLSISHQSTS